MALYFHLTSHCRLSSFQNDLVLLDLKKNKYIIFEPHIKETLINILASKVCSSAENTSVNLFTIKPFPKNANDAEIKSLIEILQEKEIITRQLFASPAVLPHPNDLKGANIDWRLEKESLEKTVSFTLKIRAFYALCRVYLILNVFGFHALVCYLNTFKTKLKKRSHEPHLLLQLNYALNQSCFYFPLRVKCLEWSASLAIMALERDINCALYIGVQTQPFSAHAWLESDGEVIGDNPLLPKHLAIILKEPK